MYVVSHLVEFKVFYRLKEKFRSILIPGILDVKENLHEPLHIFDALVITFVDKLETPIKKENTTVW